MRGARRVPLGAGTVSVGPGWEEDAQGNLQKRPEALTARLTLNAGVAAPPLSVTALAPWSEAPGTPEAALAEFLRALTGRTPGLRVVEQVGLRFDDGAPGALATVAFEPLPGMGTAQLHACRVDGGRLIHLVATCAERERARHAHELTAVLKSYR
jgi:hypothetical protein